MKYHIKLSYLNIHILHNIQNSHRNYHGLFLWLISFPKLLPFLPFLWISSMFHILFGTFGTFFGRNLKKSFRFVSSFRPSSGSPKPLRPPWPLRSAWMQTPRDFRWFCKSPDALFLPFVVFFRAFCFVFVVFLCSIFLHMKKVKTCVNHIMVE